MRTSLRTLLKRRQRRQQQRALNLLPLYRHSPTRPDWHPHWFFCWIDPRKRKRSPWR